jgi:hypothetical protein
VRVDRVVLGCTAKPAFMRLGGLNIRCRQAVGLTRKMTSRFLGHEFPAINESVKTGLQ